MKLLQKALSAVTALVMGAAVCVNVVPEFEADAATTALEFVEGMGSGWNLGNTFDSTNTWDSSLTPTDIETAWGNPATTAAMIKAIKGYGFDTVRIPVTWYQMVTGSGASATINTDYLARIKEVIDYCMDQDMYVIINMHHDGLEGCWLYNGLSSLTQYKTLWTQIGTYFASYDNSLAFEAFNEIDYDYNTLLAMNQAFIDTVRGLGGNNADRLLVIGGKNTDLTNTCSSSFQLPDDPSDMMAVSIHYYYPTLFTVCSPSDTWGTAQSTWGTSADQAELLNYFEDMKAAFTDNGIPVVLGEYGVENESKDEASRVAYTEAVATAADNYGMLACLWDSSNCGDMKYFDRLTQTFLNEELGTFYKTLGDVPTTVDGLTYTDRVTVTGVRGKSGEDGDTSITVDLQPYADYTLTNTIFSVTAENETEAGYYGFVGLGFNIFDGTDYIWSCLKPSFASDNTIIDVAFEGQYYVDGAEELSEATLFNDYLNFSVWYFGSEGTAPSAVTVDEEITLIFEEYFWIDSDLVPATTETTTTTEETTTTTEETTTTTEETTIGSTTETTIGSTTETTIGSTTETTTTTTTTTTGTATVTKYGDINCDGTISVSDIILLARYLGEDTTVEITETGILNGDCNGDNFTNTSDLSMISGVLVHLLTEEDLIPAA